MLSLGTDILICKLLLTIADAEKNVEIIRHVLSDQEEYDPLNAFKFLDCENKGYVNDNNIIDYLK